MVVYGNRCELSSCYCNFVTGKLQQLQDKEELFKGVVKSMMRRRNEWDGSVGLFSVVVH